MGLPAAFAVSAGRVVPWRRREAQRRGRGGGRFLDARASRVGATPGLRPCGGAGRDRSVLSVPSRADDRVPRVTSGARYGNDPPGAGRGLCRRGGGAPGSGRRGWGCRGRPRGDGGGAQPVESRVDGAVDLPGDVEDAALGEGREREQHAGARDAGAGPEERRRVVQEAQVCKQSVPATVGRIRVHRDRRRASTTGRRRESGQVWVRTPAGCRRREPATGWRFRVLCQEVWNSRSRPVAGCIGPAYEVGV